MKQFHGFDLDWENGLTIGLAVINSSVKYSNVSYTDHNADTGEQVETLTHSGSGYEKAMLSTEKATGFTLTVDLEHISGKDIGFVLSDGTNNMTLTFFDSPWGMIPAVDGNLSVINKDTNGTKLVAYRDPSRELDKNGTTVTRPLYNGETAISAVDYSRGACPTLSADGKRTVTVKYSNGYITVYDAGWGQCIWTYYMGDILGMKQFNGFDLDWENGLTIGLAVIDSSVKYSKVSYTEE